MNYNINDIADYIILKKNNLINRNLSNNYISY